MTNFLPNNRDIACYLVIKHSWKGKYKRILSIGTLAISTYNPQTLEITNQWEYGDFCGIKPSAKNTANCEGGMFEIHYRKQGKRDTMRFSSEYTTEILTECLLFNTKFAERPVEPFPINAFKYHWSGNQVPVILRANAAALEQVDNRGVVVKMYPYKNIRSIGKITDCPGGFLLEMGEQRRRRVFASATGEELIKVMKQMAAENIGLKLTIERETISLRDFGETRFGLCSRAELLTSYVEFRVQKFTRRQEDLARRLLCLSETCLVERAPQTYDVISVTPLQHIVCLSRLEKDPQQFYIEYDNGDRRIYASNERDLILASLLDGIRAAGNEQVFISGHGFDRALRLLPHSKDLDIEGESQCLRHIIAPPPGLKRSDLIRRFNANIPYSGLKYTRTEGLFTEKKENVIVATLEAVLDEVYDAEDPAHVHKTEAQLQCLRRLFASKWGFQSFTHENQERLGLLVMRCLEKKKEAIDHAVIEVLNALMHPMHDQYEIRVEQLNKRSLLSSPKFIESLLDLTVQHINRNSGWLVIASLLDFLTYAVCAPYSETTDGAHFDAIIKMVADRGRSFYRLFHSPSMTIVKGAGMVMRAIIEEADASISKQMQVLSLTEGAFLSHLQSALLYNGKELRGLTNKQLSGHLISLWVIDNEPAKDLLSRCLPRGLTDFLDSKDKVPVHEKDLLMPRNNLEAATNEQKQSAIKEKLDQYMIQAEAGFDRFVQHWDLERKLNFQMRRNDSQQVMQQHKVVLRRRRDNVKARTTVNWKLFAYEFSRDHAKANLLWNERTRTEFSKCIEAEQATLIAEKDRAGDLQISWNHTEFQVPYPSLEEEVRIGDYYLRLLQQEDVESATPIHNPMDFFNNVFHRYLIEQKKDMRCQCLTAMAITYARHHEEIGAFPDSKHFVSMLSKTVNPLERDRLLFLISKLVSNKTNSRQLIQAGVLPILVDFCTLAHLHVQRATIQNQTNVIEASTEQMNTGGSAEWYYNDNDKVRHGPFSFEKMKELYAEKTIFEKTAVWSYGLSNWQQLSLVPQFRWTICIPAGVSGEYNFTQMCALCLDILIHLCEFFPTRDEYGSVVRPMPAVKQRLTDANLLYHVVQLLLTYEPSIVQRVATLVLLIMEDNPFLPRLYLSGVFYFILMYNGSNVLPIARFLHYTHMKQAFRSAMFDEAHQSVLAPLLPEAATFYLEHYGPEKYAEVFLGEFDNPEIIWNTAMRRHLIEKIALHVGDFTSRLTSNVKAVYQFCPIPMISYPELENELFCHVYYLRHLCDRQRFPDWPIRDPIPFLRSCLTAWYEELDKKPPSMSFEQACETLGVKADEKNLDPNVVRRAYYKLAAKYHPDKITEDKKNKEHEYKEMFEKITAAYELLSSNLAGRSKTHDTNRIVLCLQAQSIIYSRYSEELSQYKYSGYDKLIITIDIEAKDATLFQQGGGTLLSAAVELCHYTLCSSALNAEQLRRDKGLEALQTAFDRCCPMVTDASKPSDMPVQVCEHICNCFATASKFDQCRAKMAELPTLFGNLCRLLQLPHLAKLSSAAAECICAMAVDTLLQTQLFQTGVLWQMIPHLFHFDFTLDEGGVAHSEETNKQSLANRLARSSCEALACLAGFREATPENDGVQNSLRALLTPYVCRLMKSGTTNDEVLKILNSNVQNPYLIWDNGTRAELLEFVERHRTSSVQTSELYGAEFQLSIYAKELIVGDIFVRIYNEQPEFKFTEPKAVAADLLDYMKKYESVLTGKQLKTNGVTEINWTKSANKLSTDEKVQMCMQALFNLLTSHSGVEILLIGHFNLIISYLRANNFQKIQAITLKVLCVAAGSKECLSDISNCHACSTLFVMLFNQSDRTKDILNTLIALASNGHIVREMLDYGGLMYLLNIFCDTMRDPAERLQTAELLAKLQAEKTTGTGPRWGRFINKYLPPIFSDALKDNPGKAAEMIDSTAEHPELIWNETTRSGVFQLVKKTSSSLATVQAKDPEQKWNATSLTDDWCAYADSVKGELVVGGVFLRLFIAQPGWTLSQPTKFATELLERVLSAMQKPCPELTVLTSAFVELLRHHSHIADQLPRQGYLPQFCTAMTSKNTNTSRTAILILQQLAENSLCADALSHSNCIPGIMESMKNQPTLMRESAHALKCLMQRNSGDLASQMLACGMIEYLLDVLRGSLAGVSNAAAARAEIVDTLKAASMDLKSGEKIIAILNASPTWAQYKDQRHDLFLPSTRTQAITGGTTGIAGYLTDGQHISLPTQPPPPLL